MVWDTIKKGVDHVREKMDGTLAKSSRHGRRRQLEDETQRPPTPPPRFLPTHRPRALTISSGYISPSRIADQSNSLLFSKLPSEIRRMVWKECVGVRAYHLEIERTGYSGPGRFNGTIKRSCPERDFCKGLDGHGISCHSEDDWNSTSKVPRASTRKIGILSTLVSCRLIYSEAIELLYSVNTFITTSPEVVTDLPHMLLPRRLNSITSFRFRWWADEAPYGSLNFSLPENQQRLANWLQVWKRLSSMEGLKTLHVQLYRKFESNWMDIPDGQYFGWDRTWEQLSESDFASAIAPIRKVTIPEDFILMVDFVWDKYQAAWETLPCRVTFNY